MHGLKVEKSDLNDFRGTVLLYASFSVLNADRPVYQNKLFHLLITHTAVTLVTLESLSEVSGPGCALTCVHV